MHFFATHHFYSALNDRSGPTNASQIQLHTAQGSTLTFNTPNPDDLKDLLMYLLAELRRLSRFTVAIQDNTPKGLENYM
jgi:hypothetical protein